MIIVGPPLEAPFDEPEYRRIFAAMASDPVDALLVNEIAENYAHARLIIELAEKKNASASNLPLPRVCCTWRARILWT
jgi:hypothetical protein